MRVEPCSATMVVESVQDDVMGDCVRYQTNLGAEPTQSRWNESYRNTLCSRCLVSVKSSGEEEGAHTQVAGQCCIQDMSGLSSRKTERLDCTEHVQIGSLLKVARCGRYWHSQHLSFSLVLRLATASRH